MTLSKLTGNIFFAWNGLKYYIPENKNCVDMSNRSRTKALIPLRALRVRYHEK